MGFGLIFARRNSLFRLCGVDQYNQRYSERSASALDKIGLFQLPSSGGESNQGVSAVSSIQFSGEVDSSILVANDADFKMGTENFTVEWFQYQQSKNPYPRIFSIGSWPGADFAVSIEGVGTGNYNFLLWTTGNSIYDNMGTVDVVNQWRHFAISRNGTSIKVFMDGINIGSTIFCSKNFNSNEDLRIGGETVLSDIGMYTGLISNFRWVKGTAIYTSNFTIPSSPLNAVSGTNYCY